MKPILTQIEGFGPHKSTIIDWSSLAAPTAIQGRNGTGKSFLCEADFACLYGYFPSRPGTIYDGLSQNGGTEGRIVCRFDSKGVRYEATRECVAKPGKRPSQTAKLMEWREDSWWMIAGPKVSDFEAEIDRRFGDSRMALATWMAAQHGKGDMINLDPAERRRAFASFLALEDLAAVTKSFAARSESTSGQAAIYRAQLEGYDVLKESLSMYQQTAEASSIRASELRSKLQKAQNRRQDALTEIDTLTAREQQLNARIQKREQLRSQIQQLTFHHDKDSEQLKRFEEIAANEIWLELDLLELNWNLERRTKYEFEREDFKKYNDWQKALADLEQKLSFEEEQSLREIQQKPDMPMSMDEKHAAELPGAKLKIEEARTRNAEIRKSNEERARKISDVQTRIGAINIALENDPQKPEGLCDICPALAQYKLAMEKRIKLQQEHHDLTLQLNAFTPEPLPLIDVDEQREIYDRAQIAQVRINRQAEWKKQNIATRTRIDNLKSAIAEHKQAKPEKVDDPSEKIQKASITIGLLKNTQTDLNAARAAVEILPELRSRVEGLKSQIETIEAQALALDADVSNAKSELIQLNNDRGRARNSASEAAKEVASYTQESLDASSEAAQAKEKAENCAREIEAMQDRKSKAEQLEKKAKCQAMLAQCYGPRGIQPLIFDRSAPGIEFEVNKVLQDITSGRMALRFITQQEKKDGNLKEVMLILVRDQRGERDVATYSGGEQNLVRTALRVGMSAWLARYVGIEPEQVTVDEFLDALDDENAESMLQMAFGLSSRFSCVRVVTHDQGVAARLPSRVVLDVDAMGNSSVEVFA